MKKCLFGILMFMSLGYTYAMDAAMYQWKSHFAYGEITSVVEDKANIYALAGGALFSVNKSTEQIQTYAKQDGLNGGDIAQIGYDATSKTLIIAYNDGLIDFYQNGQFATLTDLQQKTLSSSKKANCIYIENGLAYLGMPFGIMVVDIKNHLIKDTYYIGDNGADVDVTDIAMGADSIYAISSSTLFSIGKNDNLMDYQNWLRASSAVAETPFQALEVWQDQLFLVANNTLLRRVNTSWERYFDGIAVKGLRLAKDRLFALSATNGIHYLDEDFTGQTIASYYSPNDICYSNNTFWMGTSYNGVVRQTQDETQEFQVNGPLMNMPYRIRFCGDKLIMVPGGYYVELTMQNGCVMLCEGDEWYGITHEQLVNFSEISSHRSYCDAIIDPRDPTHFYSASLGCGLMEYRDNQPYQWYYSENSPLDNIAVPTPEYTWVDGLAFDSKGNLWMINLANTRNIKVKMNDGTWVAIDHAEANTMQRARDLLIWNQNENIKIITCNHTQRGLCILNDNGTIANQSDDQCVFRTEFTDQDNQQVKLEKLLSIAQDKTGALWVGTGAGLIVIDDPTQLLTGNSCRKIKIPRNDGTGLADYLLGTEQINAIAVDGANRKWIGTAGSGLYLVSEDGLETIYHFTTDNSPLVANSIVSIAIQPSTGRVYVGTDKGLMSFQNDAAPASEDYSTVYAYPNPVRPDYEGVITIRGLMDESVVHIVDNAGNLVCETRSNGGLAIWDGKTADGRRAASGVYTVYLNENTNGNHAVTKILLMH